VRFKEKPEFIKDPEHPMDWDSGYWQWMDPRKIKERRHERIKLSRKEKTAGWGQKTEDGSVDKSKLQVKYILKTLTNVI